MSSIRIENDPLDEAAKHYSKPMRRALSELRDLVLETANELEAVNALSASLKWGQASYEAVQPKTGSSIRIDRSGKLEEHYALYFICTTTLVSDMRAHYDGVLEFQGNRAILFDIDQELPRDAVKHCIAMALTYKLNKIK